MTTIFTDDGDLIDLQILPTPDLAILAAFYEGAYLGQIFQNKEGQLAVWCKGHLHVGTEERCLLFLYQKEWKTCHWKPLEGR